MIDVSQHQIQSHGDGADVGQSLHLQEPYHVEPVEREPSRPQDERHQEDGEHTVEHREEAVGLEEQQSLHVGSQEQHKGKQDLVQAAPKQHLELVTFTESAEIAYHEDDDGIHHAEEQLHLSQPCEMLREHLVVTGDIAAVEVGDAQVEQDIKKVGEVEDREVLPVERVAEHVLHLTVDAQNPERLHQ